MREKIFEKFRGLVQEIQHLNTVSSKKAKESKHKETNLLKKCNRRKRLRHFPHRIQFLILKALPGIQYSKWKRPRNIIMKF